MTPAVFFYADAADTALGDECRLEGAEAHHAGVVRRLRVGERVELTNGRGVALRCEVTELSRGAVRARVLARRDEPPPPIHLTVVQALPKGDRGERAVEMLTEVGVHGIVPWSATRSMSKWPADRSERARGRWAQTARESAKQSRRAWWPIVEELATTADVAQQIQQADMAWVLRSDGSIPLASAAQALADATPASVVLVVGPEGDLTDEEVALFTAAGAAVARLGSTILRTSTAGVVASTLVLANAWR